MSIFVVKPLQMSVMLQRKFFKYGVIISLLLFNIYVKKVSAQQDTSYYVKYSEMLSLGIFEEIRNNTLSFERTDVAGGQPNTIKYNTNGQKVTGLIINYDKIYFAFGIKTERAEAYKKGKSNNTNFALRLQGRKMLIEATYRNYKGFYDENTPLYFSSFEDSTPYYRDESLRNRTFKAKSFYFLNHDKFSYNASYFGSYRQLKSAASWVLNANFYTTTIRADSSIIPYYARDIFVPYSYVKRITVNCISVGGGASANLVIFKRFFFNATFILGLEPQWRTYELMNEEKTSQFFVSAAFDFRSAIGYNSKRFFMFVTSFNDVTLNNSGSIVFTGNFLSGAFVVGYRFPFENGVTKALKSNKIYQTF